MAISSLSRRDFLKKGSIGTAALFVGLNSNGVLAAALSSSGEVMVNPFVKI
jgi:anaerobic selenocysteine-containing dehydrogenase